jgi:LysR family transcriptional regulator, low CO2-responsive transcriptional regulator
MTSAQLKAFYAVAKFGSFTLAAQHLSLTQPAISDHIKKLEVSYGTALFRRVAKGVKLTDIGAKLFAIAERHSETESEAKLLLSQAKELEAGELALGADAAVHIMPHLAIFRSQHPKIGIKFVSGNTNQLIANLKDYTIDFAIVAMLPADETISALHLGTQKIVAIVSAKSTLAKRKSLTLRELAHRTIIVREHGSITRSITMNALQKLSLIPSQIIEAETRETSQELVAQDLGFALVPKAEITPDPRIVAITLADCDEEMSEWLLCLKARQNLRIIQAFLGTVTNLSISVAKRQAKPDNQRESEGKRK